MSAFTMADFSWGRFSPARMAFFTSPSPLKACARTSSSGSFRSSEKASAKRGSPVLHYPGSGIAEARLRVPVHFVDKRNGGAMAEQIQTKHGIAGDTVILGDDVVPKHLHYKVRVKAIEALDDVGADSRIVVLCSSGGPGQVLRPAADEERRF